MLPLLKNSVFMRLGRLAKVSLEQSLKACAVSCLVLRHFVQVVRCAHSLLLARKLKRYFPFISIYLHYKAKSKQSQYVFLTTLIQLLYTLGTTFLLLSNGMYTKFYTLEVQNE